MFHGQVRLHEPTVFQLKQSDIAALKPSAHVFFMAVIAGYSAGPLMTIFQLWFEAVDADEDRAGRARIARAQAMVSAVATRPTRARLETAAVAGIAGRSGRERTIERIIISRTVGLIDASVTTHTRAPNQEIMSGATCSIHQPKKKRAGGLWPLPSSCRAATFVERELGANTVCHKWSHRFHQKPLRNRRHRAML